MKIQWKKIGIVFVILLTLTLVTVTAGCMDDEDEQKARKGLSGKVISIKPVGEDKVEVTISATNTWDDTAKDVYAYVNAYAKNKDTRIDMTSISFGDIKTGQTVTKTAVFSVSDEKYPGGFDHVIISDVFRKDNS